MRHTTIRPHGGEHHGGELYMEDKLQSVDIFWVQG